MAAVLEALIDGYTWLIWTVVSIVLAWWALVLCFYAVMYAKILVEDRHVSFHWFFLVPIYVGFIVGVLLDIVFNFTWGTVAFRETPREWVFTARCKRHKKKGITDWRGRKGIWWCDQLNKIEAGHC